MRRLQAHRAKMKSRVRVRNLIIIISLAVCMLLIIGIVLFYVIVDSKKLDIDLDNGDRLELIIKEEQIKKSSIPVLLRNKTDSTLYYTPDIYYIRKWQLLNWIPLLDENAQKTTTALSGVIEANSEISIEIKWDNIFPELTGGKYILLLPYDDGKECYCTGSEFEYIVESKR